jgi:hypothetical protein
MKTSKKILMILTSCAIVSAISAGLSFGLSIFGISFWPAFWLIVTIQFLAPVIWDRLYDSRKLVEALNEYRAKPYRKYSIPLNCTHCNAKNEVEIDLTDTEFRCENCKKFNGIHVNFMTAAITEPLE